MANDDYLLGNIQQLTQPNFGAHIGNAKGWVCPKCGGVMSPELKTCHFCKPKNESTDQGLPECLLG